MKDDPDQEMRKSIETFKAQRSRGRAYALSAMQQYRKYLDAVHRGPEAKQVALEEAQLMKQLGNCANCTVSVYRLQERH